MLNSQRRFLPAGRKKQRRGNCECRHRRPLRMWHEQAKLRV